MKSQSDASLHLLIRRILTLHSMARDMNYPPILKSIELTLSIAEASRQHDTPRP